jgi:Ss-1,4-galactosyltransferase
MNQDLISIIVPIYNVESYVEQCIASLTAQTYERLEIILVDDGSTDGSPAICDAWAEKDPRIMVIHKQNGGLSDARNTGIEAAHGEYLMLIDGDDYILPMTCERLRQIAHKFDADIVISNLIYVYPDGTHKYYRPEEPHQCMCCTGEEAFAEYFKTFRFDFMIAPTKFYRRELFFSSERIRFPFGRLGEDVYTNYRLLYEANKVGVTSEAFYCYVQRSGSITSNYTPRFIRDLIDCTKGYLEWGADKPLHIQKLLERGSFRDFFYLQWKIDDIGMNKELRHDMDEFYLFIQSRTYGVLNNEYMGKSLRMKYLIYCLRLYPVFLFLRKVFVGIHKALRH